MNSDSGTIDRDSAISPGQNVPPPSSSEIGRSGLQNRKSDPAQLHVSREGTQLVVGFGGRDVPNDFCISESRQFLVNLVREHSCQELQFDVTGVRLIPSGMLGVIASMRNLGVNVSVRNPSQDVKEVLETTQLDQIIKVVESG